jgi:hypothetical protein
MKNIITFNKFIKEDATATMGNSNGMGAVIAANPSSTPGDVADSSIGSGDIGQTLIAKPNAKILTKKEEEEEKEKKKKKSALKIDNFNHEQDKPYDQMYVVRFGDYKYTKDAE